MPSSTIQSCEAPPPVSVGQFMQAHTGTLYRVVEPLDAWEVSLARVHDGKRTRVARLYKWGPLYSYTHFQAPEVQVSTVHIRRVYGGEVSDTFCGLLATGLITTTMANIGWWKRRAKSTKQVEICSGCSKRATDGVHSALDQLEAA